MEMDIQSMRGNRAIKLEYFTPFFVVWRSMTNQHMVNRLISTILIHSDSEIILVGHSNGAEIITDTLEKILKYYPNIKISAVHLVAGATDHDFNKNHLNESLRKNIVSRVYVYGSKTDYVLKYAAGVSFIFGPLRYGQLGYRSAIDKKSLNISSENTDRVEIIIRDSGHGEWFQRYYSQTLNQIVDQNPS